MVNDVGAAIGQEKGDWLIDAQDVGHLPIRIIHRLRVCCASRYVEELDELWIPITQACPFAEVVAKKA